MLIANKHCNNSVDKHPIYQQRATRCIFFCTGFLTAVWATLIPFLKVNTGASDGELGGLLLCMGTGALVAMPLVGPLTSRFGCRTVITTGLLGLLVSVGFIPVITHFWVLAGVVMLTGVCIGAVDCAMNIQAVLVEKASKKALMSGFHGFYSLGGIVGAIVMAVMLSIVTVLTSVLISIVLVLCGFAYYQRFFLSYGNKETGPAFAWPKGAVIFIGLSCFCMFLAEGTVLDWSSVFLTEHRGVPLSYGGIGFAAFSIAMTIARLTGDTIVTKYGGMKVVTVGTLLATCGLAAVLFVPDLYFAIAGYFLIGLGAANVVPVMFSAIANQRDMSEHIAVPAVSTMAYSGVLLGPASIGVVAQSYNLSAALGIVFILFLLVLALMKSIPYQAQQPG